jgi:hypothetical protein
MVNQPPGPGSDAQLSGARASVTTPMDCEIVMETQLNDVDCDNVLETQQADLMTRLKPNEADGANIPTPSSNPEDLHFLTKDEGRALLPNPWRSALPKTGLGIVERLHVTADGSCAGGSVMLGRADPARGMITAAEARSSHNIAQFRTEYLTSHVRAWTAVDWIKNVPQQLRLELWDVRPPCGCETGRGAVCRCLQGPIPERDLFCDLCSRPNYAIGPIFFHIAAAVMQLGVLLLVHDDRHSQFRERRVYDFGTKDYAVNDHLRALPPAASEPVTWYRPLRDSGIASG